MQVFTNPEEHAEMHGLLVNQTLREKDRDGDGMISFDEYLGDRGRFNTNIHMHAHTYTNTYAHAHAN